MISTKLARLEAEGIKTLRPRHDLRVHCSGDARTKTAAKILGNAMISWELRSKNNSLAYTYTHAWQSPYNVHYEAWQGARVLASIDNVSDYDKVTQELGYPAATMVIPEAIPTYKTDNNLMVLCPYPKHDCRDCRLCFMSMEWLRDNRVIIMFPAHGNHKQAAKDLKGGCYADYIWINRQSSKSTVKVQEYSKAKKVYGMSVTYAPFDTCPTSCKLHPSKHRSK